MSYYYNPLDQGCKSRVGAIACGCEITFYIREQLGGEDSFSAESCFFVFYKDGEVGRELPMKREKDGFSLAAKFNCVGLYFYHFRLAGKQDVWGNVPVHFLGKGTMRNAVLCDTPQSWQLTVFSEDYVTPDWLKGGIMYQIFPDRFCKKGEYPIAENKILRRDWGGTPHYKTNPFGKVLNNDFFGGNLNGITEKLDYLKSLHVSVIYLNPIFEAYSNHRYDTGDYMKIDPLLGTEQDFDNLVQEADKRGIKIVLDGVFNHTGDDSRYFNKYGRYKEELGAHQSPDSKYSDWYHFTQYPDSYDSWWGIDTLPAINERSESYQQFIFGQDGVLKHWLKHGIGGYRLDVADELPDFFLQKLRKTVKEENPDAVIIGEVWEDASNKIAYSERRQYLLGGELDSVMNYPLKDAIINFVLTQNTQALRETLAVLIDNYPKQTLDSLMNILGTHDTSRIITVFGGKSCSDKDEMSRTNLNKEEREKAIQRMKMAIFLQFTLPGVPCIYYGDENGIEGYHDPFCRRCFDWNYEEKELLDLYKMLGKIRVEILPDIFTEGSYREIFADSFCLVYERKTATETAYFFINNSAALYDVALTETYLEHLTQTKLTGNLTIPAYSYGILTKLN